MKGRIGRKKRKANRRNRGGWNVVSSQLTSHLTSVWKVKISLEVYFKLYERRARSIFCPESKGEKKNQKGLYHCAIDFRLTSYLFLSCRATSSDFRLVHVTRYLSTVFRSLDTRGCTWNIQYLYIFYVHICIVFWIHCASFFPMEFYFNSETIFLLTNVLSHHLRSVETL